MFYFEKGGVYYYFYIYSREIILLINELDWSPLENIYIKWLSEIAQHHWAEIIKYCVEVDQMS